MRFRPGSAPNPAGEAYDAPQTLYPTILRLDSRAFGASISEGIVSKYFPLEPPLVLFT